MDAVLAADLCHSQPGLLLFDHPDELRLGETALAHASALSGLGRLYIRLRELPGGRSAAATFNGASVPTCYGKKFTDRLFGLRKRSPTGKHDFDQLCAELGIEHRLASPQHPQTNGMVERFNGRIEEVLKSHHFISGEDLETTLYRYVLLYNQQLPQSALGDKAPLQAMKDCHKLKP